MMEAVDTTQPYEHVIAATVLSTLAELTGRDAGEIRYAHQLVADLGVDSFMLVELVASLEKRFTGRLAAGNESRLTSAKTVGEFIAELANLMNERR